MLEFKWGMHDDIFHSVKATVKKFKEFKDTDVKELEDRALTAIEQILTEIYACPNCHTDIRKCGVMRRTAGQEIVELYISEDGKQARTHHDKFEATGNVQYNCMSCQAGFNNGLAIYDFLRKGISRNVCIDFLHRHHPNIATKYNKNRYDDEPFEPNVEPGQIFIRPNGMAPMRDNEFPAQPIPMRPQNLDRLPGTIRDNGGGGTIGGQIRPTMARNDNGQFITDALAAEIARQGVADELERIRRIEQEILED